MRRADRLFQIVQLLRTRRWMTAAQIAEKLEVSVRTIYRDMQDLSLTGTPIISETGVGYSLDKSYNLPSITFSEAELESLILGARMVQAWSDKLMAADATRALERIESILPDQLKSTLHNTELMVPTFHVLSDVAEKMPNIRKAIKIKRKLNLDYKRADGKMSERIVRPLGLFFWGNVWTLVAWCELRDGFRQFRIDRMQMIVMSKNHFEACAEQSLNYFLIHEAKQGR